MLFSECSIQLYMSVAEGGVPVIPNGGLAAPFEKELRAENS